MKQLEKNLRKMLADMKSELDIYLVAIVAECERKSYDFTADGEGQK